MTSSYFSSSIGRKQIVAITGLLLIGFIIGHLAGNLFIFLGPEAFNNYAKKLSGLRPALYLVEFGLLILFVIHMYVTARIVLENRKSRKQNYAQFTPKRKRSFATRIMPYTGTAILAFVIWHLLDFTFVDKAGPMSVLADGKSYGLYGIVYNAFSDPLHSLLYIIAVCCLGFHLAHGVDSFIQTMGINKKTKSALIRKISFLFSILIVVLYSSIPIYILIKNSL